MLGPRNDPTSCQPGESARGEAPRRGARLAPSPAGTRAEVRPRLPAVIEPEDASDHGLHLGRDLDAALALADADLRTGLEIERLHFAGLFGTQDAATGMRSFMENGPGKATFAGR